MGRIRMARGATNWKQALALALRRSWGAIVVTVTVTLASVAAAQGPDDSSSDPKVDSETLSKLLNVGATNFRLPTSRRRRSICA